MSAAQATDGRYCFAWRLADGEVKRSAWAGTYEQAIAQSAALNRRWPFLLHWPEVALAPCPACHGRRYFTEDPAPDCPSVAYVGTETECSKCDGTGQVAT